MNKNENENENEKKRKGRDEEEHEEEPQIKKQKEDEENCAICMEHLKVKDRFKLIQCNHDEFHKACINSVINSRRNETPGPSCPMCRTPIIRSQWPPRPSSQLSIDNSQTRLQKVIDYENSRGETPVPFLGIAICIDGQMIIKYLNTDFNLGTINTLNDLKTAILSRSDEIASQRGFFCPANLRLLANNAVSTIGLTQHLEPSFRINRIGFGVPLSCDFNFADSDYNEPDLGGTLLKDLYTEYQSGAKDVLDNREDYERIPTYVHDNLKSVYKNHTIHFPIGTATTDYFLNSENPDIPEEFRPREVQRVRYIEKATNNSLAWLIVHIECTTHAGGKTKKRRFKKGNKSIKRKKSIKKRKSIKRKSIK